MARLKHFGNSLGGVSGGGDSVVCIFLDGLGLWATQRLSQAALVTKRWCSGRSHDAFSAYSLCWHIATGKNGGVLDNVSLLP